MTDTLETCERSALMARIHGRDTKPELVVRSALHRMGFRFRLCRRDLPGSPDIVLTRHGSIHVRRAYGNWKQGGGWEEKLHPFAILPVQRFPYTKGKNATDLAMAIDAVELLFTEDIDGFALVTSDCDFTPLAMKIRSKGKDVFGFGEAKTPAAFVNACSQFIRTDDFREPSPEDLEPKTSTRKSRSELRGDTELMNTLRTAIQSSEGDDGWASLGKIGQFIANQSSLSPKNYGYAKWGDLIRATEYFEEDVRNQNLSHFRLKKGAKQG